MSEFENAIRGKSRDIIAMDGFSGFDVKPGLTFDGEVSNGPQDETDFAGLPVWTGSDEITLEEWNQRIKREQSIRGIKGGK